MTVSRWISLFIVALYVTFFLCMLHVGGESPELSQEDFEAILGSALGLLVWLGLCLACIWYGDEMGEGLVGARFGLVSSPSPGWAVQLMGWVLLLLPVLMVIYCALADEGQ